MLLNLCNHGGTAFKCLCCGLCGKTRNKKAFNLDSSLPSKFTIAILIWTNVCNYIHRGWKPIVAKLGWADESQEVRLHRGFNHKWGDQPIWPSSHWLAMLHPCNVKGCVAIGLKPYTLCSPSTVLEAMWTRWLPILYLDMMRLSHLTLGLLNKNKNNFQPPMWCIVSLPQRSHKKQYVQAIPSFHGTP